MIPLPTAEFWQPSDNTLTVLRSPWICSFSGGKDSSALVTWLEWLRREGIIRIENPRLVLSDTGVEYPFLQETTNSMIQRLTDCGWNCHRVTPPVHKRLYNSIFGRGLAPVHPAHRKRMRWCTNATKVQPMQTYARSLSRGIIQLSGIRWGESKNRDGKLLATACVSGNECGLPPPGKNRYAPIITWTMTNVIDWLLGFANLRAAKKIKDLIQITQQLVQVYGVKTGPVGFGLWPPKVTSLRFGCIGCPALSRDKVLDSKVKDNPSWRALKRLYWLWEILREPRNRISKMMGNEMRLGPIRMEVRRRYFEDFLRIQKASGVKLIDREDEMYIRNCWENKVYPKGWSAEDEQ